MIAIAEAPTSSESSLYSLTSEHHRAVAACYQAAVDNGLSTALWRYPQAQAQYALVDFSGSPQTTKIDFAKNSAGFAFSPFVNPDGQATLFIKADFFLDEAGQHFLDDPLDATGLAQENKIRFLADYQRLVAGSEPMGYHWEATHTQPYMCPEAEYRQLVAAAIQHIKSTGIKKIVTSRATETVLPVTFNPLRLFETLCQRYQHAFVSLVSLPMIGTWIGVSPELLLSLTQEEIRTVALAGTQPRPTNAPLSSVIWGNKEIEEQALVSDYIREFFQQAQLPHIAEDGPRTVSAGQIVHLQTQFRVGLSEPTRSRLANQILHQLHPTSAVCGMPKKDALAFLLQNENYDRAFYSGFLGPVHLQGRSDLFVNLRCMQLKQKRAILYVGGGITQDSDPEAEWLETVLKSRTLLNVLYE